jgi:hypothetical protein
MLKGLIAMSDLVCRPSISDEGNAEMNHMYALTLIVLHFNYAKYASKYHYEKLKESDLKNLTPIMQLKELYNKHRLNDESEDK